MFKAQQQIYCYYGFHSRTNSSLHEIRARIIRLLSSGLNHHAMSANSDRFLHTKSAHKVVIKVASKILKQKERNCTFENLSLRCSATKKSLWACGLALFRAMCPTLPFGCCAAQCTALGLWLVQTETQNVCLCVFESYLNNTGAGQVPPPSARDMASSSCWRCPIYH